MSGHTPWREIKHKATPEQLERARSELAQAISLAELRRARDYTQAQLAQALETTQPGISRVERQTDLYLSTLRSYIEALGGELHLVAAFPDGTVTISTLGELERPEASGGPATPEKLMEALMASRPRRKS